jgi:hypothetical protein
MISTQSRTSGLRRVLLALLITLLFAVLILVTVGATSPLTLAPLVGLKSSALAIIIAAASALALAVMPALTLMGRIGAIMLAVPVATLLALDLASSDSNPATTGFIPLDMLLSVMIPAGYFVLLFGALRAAGWGFAGSGVALGVAIISSIVIWVVPSSSLSDLEMADRLVAHGLINVGVVTALLALLLEFVWRQNSRSAVRADTNAVSGTPD